MSTEQEENVLNEVFQPFEDDFALFIESGFLAVKQLDEVGASRLFRAAQLLNPTSVVPQVGLGYISLNKLEVKKAIEIFEAVLKTDPENHITQAFLGMAFLLQKGKRKKGEKLIQNALEHTTDPTVKNLAESLLQWSKDTEAKTTSPFFGLKYPEEDETPEETTEKK